MGHPGFNMMMPRGRWLGTVCAWGVGIFLCTASASGEMLVSGVSREPVEDFAVSSGEEAVDRAEQVEVISLSGLVEIKRAGSSETMAAEEGMFLSSGDTVKTGSGASVELGFDENDRNIVRVEEKTTCVVLLRDSEKIELLQGEVFSIIGDIPSGDAFLVRTPTAVAGARGTEWVTRYAGEETEVEAYEDVPFVRSIDQAGRMGQEVRVTTGKMARVARFGEPVPMGDIPRPRQERWQNMKRDIGQKVQAARERRGRPDRGPALRGERGPGEQGRPSKAGSVGEVGRVDRRQEPGPGLDRARARAFDRDRPSDAVDAGRHRLEAGPSDAAPRDARHVREDFDGKRNALHEERSRVRPGSSDAAPRQGQGVPDETGGRQMGKIAVEKSNRFDLEQVPAQRARRAAGQGARQAAPRHDARRTLQKNLNR